MRLVEKPCQCQATILWPSLHVLDDQQGVQRAQPADDVWSRFELRHQPLRHFVGQPFCSVLGQELRGGVRGVTIVQPMAPKLAVQHPRQDLPVAVNGKGLASIAKSFPGEALGRIHHAFKERADKLVIRGGAFGPGRGPLGQEGGDIAPQGDMIETGMIPVYLSQADVEGGDDSVFDRLCQGLLPGSAVRRQKIFHVFSGELAGRQSMAQHG